MGESPFERYQLLLASLQGPLAAMASQQEKLRRTVESPALLIARRQDALHGLYDKLRMITEQQERTQRILEGLPLREFERFQRQVAQATFGPLYVLARYQERVRWTMGAVAALDPWEVAAATPDVSSDAAERAWQDEAGQWLVDFIAAVVELRPSKATLWLLIHAVTILIAAILWMSTYTTTKVPEAPLAAAAVLLEGGAFLYRAVEEVDQEE
jgi:hypothetical protein